MGRISKLFKGEIKKIFLGPGIFFMAAFLILALTIAPKLFNPSEKKDINSSISINATSVTDTYTSFNEYKLDFSSNISEIKNEYNFLISNNTDFKQNLLNISDDLYDLRTEFNSLIHKGTNPAKLNCLNNLIEKTQEYKNLYDFYLNSSNTPLVLVTKEIDFDINFELETLDKILNKSGDKTTDDYYLSINESLKNYKCTVNLKNLTEKINNLKYSSENLQNILDKYQDEKLEYKNDILTNINSNLNEASLNEEYNISLSNINETKNLAIKYLSCESNLYNIYRENLLLEVSSSYSDSQICNYLKFENFNRYSHQESLSKYDYLYNTNSSDSNFSAMFSFNAISGSTVNTFDYMYFTLEIASFLIIAFTVVIGAGMIAKEYSDGTIKLLAIRPFNRNKIVFAKVLATMFISFLFIMIVAIVSLITGCILFGGISFPTMLIVLNGTITFTLPSWVVFLIYIACLLIKIWIFALLSIAISVLFKSYVLAVCLSAGIYILNLIITFVSKGATWLKYNIFANIDLFKFFGGSFTQTYSDGQNLNNLFVSPVFADTNMWTSLIVISLTALVLNLIIFTVFKHRDIN